MSAILAIDETVGDLSSAGVSLDEKAVIVKFVNERLDDVEIVTSHFSDIHRRVQTVGVGKYVGAQQHLVGDCSCMHGVVKATAA